MKTPAQLFMVQKKKTKVRCLHRPEPAQKDEIR